MDVHSTSLEGMLLCQGSAHTDSRGSFTVTYNREELAEVGITADFLQDNLIKTCRGTLRGMHFQSRSPQGKLVTVLQGEVYDAAVDLRPQSPTFGRGEGFLLRADDQTSLWVPPGFAHGCLALSKDVIYLYKVTAPWDPEGAHVLAWDDPNFALPWPLLAGQKPVLSSRDTKGLTLSAVSDLLL